MAYLDFACGKCGATIGEKDGVFVGTEVWHAGCFIEKQRYGCDQHDLICEALNVSPDPEAPGDTAFEAVVRLEQRLAAAEAERGELRQLLRELTARSTGGSVVGCVRITVTKELFNKALAALEGEMSEFNYMQMQRDIINRLQQEKDDLTARLAAAEAERDVERRDRTAAEFEMLADRELLRELYEHEINEYGRWTAGMCQRVCVAAKGGRDEI